MPVDGVDQVAAGLGHVLGVVEDQEQRGVGQGGCDVERRWAAPRRRAAGRASRPRPARPGRRPRPRRGPPTTASTWSSSASAAVTSSASRVLPTPPGPVSVTTRWPASRRSTSSWSCWRPTSGPDGRATVRRADQAGGRSRAASSPEAISCSRRPRAGPGSRPVSAARRRRYVVPAAIASAVRPSRASACMSRRTPRSRSGSAATAALASATAEPSPTAMRASHHLVVQPHPQLVECHRLDVEVRVAAELLERRPAPELRAPRAPDRARGRAGGAGSCRRPRPGPRWRRARPRSSSRT